MAGRIKGQGSKWIRKTTRHRIYSRDNFRCVFCSAHASDGIQLSLDHILASELGGDNKPTNLVTACVSCNSSKQHKTLSEFVEYLADKGIASDDIPRRVRNATRRKLPKLPDDYFDN